jgi:hypothetical protein
MNHKDIVVLTGFMFALALAALLYLFMRYQATQHDKRFFRGRYVNGDMTGRNHMARMSVNGVEITGSNVIAYGGQFIVDGVDYTETLKSANAHKPFLEIKVLEGDIKRLHSSANVICGDVLGDVDAGGSVTCKNVEGNVESGGSIYSGNVGGNVEAGGSVNCGNVEGNIDAGGSVKHG